MPVSNVTYATRPSANSNGAYIAVYAPDGSYVSRHTNVEECTQSALRHAEARDVDGVFTYRFVPPEKHMTVQIIRRVPGVSTRGVTAFGLMGEANAVGYAGAVSYPATGDNYSRILAILNGRSPHFTQTPPTDPTTTQVITVTSASQFNQYAGGSPPTGTANGWRININSSFGGALTITASDIDVVMSKSATHTGSLTLGGNPTRAQRVRWTGGNRVGTFTGLLYNDLMIDDVFWSTPGNGSSPIDFALVIGTVQSRVAVINTTFQVTSNPGGNDWATYMPGIDDLFIGNFKSLSAGQNNRFIQVRRCAIVDSVFNPDGASGNGMRIHNVSNLVWIKDSWSRGLFKLDATNGTDPGPSVTNALFDNYDRYDTLTGYALHGSGGAWVNNNTGEIRNSTLYGGTFSSGQLTNGTGNASASWDGSTVPDYSSVGAVR